MKALWLAVLLVHPGLKSETLGTQSIAAPAAAAVVRFGFDRPAAKVKYRFELSEDGRGTYVAEYPPTPPATPGGSVEVALMLHAATLKKIFEQARSTVVYHGGCETKAKNIAQTGAKTLTLLEVTGAASTCTWNYSEKAPVAALQDEFIAMAETLDVGRTLKMQQRFDRLGLDREMAFLDDEVKSGRAQGLENIAPVLQGIVDDESLLERVRARGRALLQLSAVQR